MTTLPPTLHSFDATPIHCWAALPGSGAPAAKIVLVHGFGTHSESLHFGFLRDHLIGKGFAVYGFDLRGFGRSGGRRAYVHRWQDFRDDLRLFVKAVKQDGPMAPLFVLGVSLGGLIAVDYALHHPEGIRGVITLSPAFDASGVPAWRRVLLSVLANILPGLALKTGLDVTRLSRDREAQRKFLADPLRQERMTLRLASQSIAAMEQTAHLLPGLKVPLLVLHGSADVIIPAAAGRRLYELAGSTAKEFRLFDGAFHILNMETNREEVFDCISSWMKKRLGPHAADTREDDRLVVERLVKAGADLSLPREVLYFFFFPDEKAATSVVAELRQGGFEVEDPLAPDGKVSDQWWVLATVETIVNLGTAQESTKRFRALAAQYGGEYDGWEAAATP